MRWSLPVLMALVACGDDGATTKMDAMVDSPSVMGDVPVDGKDPNNPLTLADTGLCLDAGCTQISTDVYAFQPQFQLWSDAATKKRWIYLPPGTQINTANMDFWEFPVGTKLWKEFTRDNVRVETRLVMRIGNAGMPSDWFYVPYVWNASQDATTAQTAGVQNANGTQHDVPSRFDCKSCHENVKPTRILGFSAIQLDWDNPDAAQLDLKELVAKNLLTNPPAAPSTVGAPYFPLPGTTYEPPALGYLHANCGHCHNPTSGNYGATPMELRLTVATLGALSTTPAYTTAVNCNTNVGGTTATKIIVAGQPSMSAMIERFESTNPTVHMPQKGSEVMDPTGDTTLKTWITNIP
ncbi:MAG TPA: hypothetical protein VMZ53_07960 [Kofleriaceae bacterium]|nr:hypothetical protein [Kofleriaceae bacterium]